MGTGRKKIEIKKIEKQTARMVTFSKRRKGLFKKAEQLQSMMTGSKIAIVVFSPAGNPYTFGDVDSINAALQSCLKSKKGGCCEDINLKGQGQGQGGSTTAAVPGFCGGFDDASSSRNCTYNEINMYGGFEFESARCSAEFGPLIPCSV